jgi:myo-inositol-1(or 4)-monophosphatase
LTADWLELCRGVVDDLRRVLDELPGRSEREPVVGTGMGGDQTTAVDAAAEQAIVRRLEALHADGADFTLVSEELGMRVFGRDGRRHVVVDPIDGSLNAKRGIPIFSVSVAVAEGETMGDVSFGYVYDFGTGEEWTAERNGGARLDGRRLGSVRPKDRLEILALEATRTPSVADAAAALVGSVARLRILGSLALSLCHLAAGRVDAVASLRPARAVDIAAAQLLVRECGLVISLPQQDDPFIAARLDVERRSRVVAAGSAETCRTVAAALAT